jgi:hypothetical protein
VRLLSGSLAPGCRTNEFGQLFESQLIAYEQRRHAGKAVTRGADGFETFARPATPVCRSSRGASPMGLQLPRPGGQVTA